jgi:hypothetical protein
MSIVGPKTEVDKNIRSIGKCLIVIGFKLLGATGRSQNRTDEQGTAVLLFAFQPESYE